MKKILATVFVFLTLLFIPSSIHAQQYDPLTGEHIKSFDSQITVNKDGTIDVKEQILYDFSTHERHGIFRDIPTILTINSPAGEKKYSLEFTNLSITDDEGKQYNYKESTNNNVLDIKIGDANKTITGVHPYVIAYKVSGALSYLNDHDEIYWDITGNDWNVAIATASATVILPDSITQDQIKNICFTGYTGSTDQDCGSTIVGSIASFHSNNVISPSQGLTIATAFPKGQIAVLEPKEIVNFWTTPFGKVVFVLAALLIAWLVVFWYLIYPIWIPIRWFLKGRDPDVGKAVTAWYDPPKTPGGRSLTPAEVGTLIDENAELKDILATIIDLARRGYIKIEERNKKDFYFTRLDKNDGLEPFEKVLLVDIFSRSNEIRLKDQDLYTTFETTKKTLYKILEKEKLFPDNFTKIRTYYIAITWIAVFTMNFPLALISYIFGRNMPQKTREGAKAAKEAEGLKNFLSSQERELKFQADKQLFFEKLLPFAIAFGVEEIWAKRFETLGIKQPTWYSGYYGNNFSTAYMISSLHDTSSQLRSISAPPSSSGSGFSGGSSGGGGGGGGGGSW